MISELRQVNWGLVLASFQVILCGVAAIGYACVGDWKRVTYWVASGVIIGVVTWGF